MKAIRNHGACHADPDAEGTKAESDADVEKEFHESTGQKRNYNCNHAYQGVGHGTSPSFQMSDALSMWMPSVGENIHQTGVQAA
jgi:hypothetical protein